MIQTTVGQALINQGLPPDLRNFSRVIDKKGISTLMQEVAERYPDQYGQIVKHLLDVGKDAAYYSGSNSFGLDELEDSRAADKFKQEIQNEVVNIIRTERDPEVRNKKIIEAISKRQKDLEKAVYDEGIAEGSPLAEQLIGAGRGKPFNYNSLRGFDGLYLDQQNRPIPFPVFNSYSRGLTPAEYFASSFGARKGIVDVQKGTADAGFLNKQLGQITHRLLVTEDDTDDEEYSRRGMPVDVDDDDNVGALLAAPIGGYERNEVLTPKILRDLQSKGVKRMLVRSPILGGPEMGGVYAKDIGIRERGDIPPVGDYVGLASAQALGEVATQMALSSKHSGGVAAAGGGATAGFPTINQLIQVPKHFPGGASHAQEDGTVTRIEAAPQGGHYIYVGQTAHYAGPDRQVNVKMGDEVEAGDTLTDGLSNPAEITKHKGIGEGRRAFANQLRKTLSEGGTTAQRRHLELLARGLIDHVTMHGEIGPYVPEDTVPYSALERVYEPREGYQDVPVAKAKGMYLEKPILHYTIGTKVRPSVMKDLQEFGITNVTAHKEPPIFTPNMVRGVSNISKDPDWMTRMIGSGQKRSLLDSVHRGASSNMSGTSFVPAIAGENFGTTGLTAGWEADDDEDFEL